MLSHACVKFLPGYRTRRENAGAKTFITPRRGLNLKNSLLKKVRIRWRVQLCPAVKLRKIDIPFLGSRVTTPYILILSIMKTDGLTTTQNVLFGGE